MSISIDQFLRGALRFADYEVIPHLPGGKGIGAAIAIDLILDGSREKILALRENPTVGMMNVIDEGGNINIDRLYSVVRPRFANGLSVSVPLIGELKFNQNDVDNLYRYVQEA